MLYPLLSHLTYAENERLQALAIEIDDARAFVLAAIERRDFSMTEYGFSTYRDLLREKTALVLGRPQIGPRRVLSEHPAMGDPLMSRLDDR
jgi:hypothetical protein